MKNFISYRLFMLVKVYVVSVNKIMISKNERKN